MSIHSLDDQRRQRPAEREHEAAGDDHAAGAVAIRDGAEDRLRRTPHELPDRHGEADRDDAQPGGRIERRHEQAEGLPAAHA